MKISLKSVTIRELVDGFRDDGEGGVVGYGGRLDIRPAFQREFVYNDRQQLRVVDTAFYGFPLNAMYWNLRGDGGYEVIDGQQRTLSLCNYVAGNFVFDGRFFSNLTKDEQDKFLDYDLSVFVCEGDESERLIWFKRINIAGVTLTEQELLNAVFAGSFVSDAKKYFRHMGAGYEKGKHLVSGNALRQDFLATALNWVSGGDARRYMADHQHDPDAKALWKHYCAVVDWVNGKFPKRTSFMKGVDWGSLYMGYRGVGVDAEELDRLLYWDDEVQNKRGVYSYVLDRNPKHLNLRSFSPAMKEVAYNEQDGICAGCNERYDLDHMQADHKLAWSEGGKTVQRNCQVLCRICNSEKGAR